MMSEQMENNLQEFSSEALTNTMRTILGTKETAIGKESGCSTTSEMDSLTKSPFQLGTYKTSTVDKIFKHEDYNALVCETVETIKLLSSIKGGEYAGDQDRLANFRRNASALGLENEQVWSVYAAKHWDAIMQYVKDLGTGKQRRRMESIEGRADDLIVYLILFKAMFRDRQA